MTKVQSKNWYLYLIKGILMVLFSVLIFTNPGEAVLGVLMYVGIGLIFTGIMVIWQGFSIKDVNANWGWKVFEGVLDLILGFSFINSPLATMEAIPIMIGFWASYYGIMLVIAGFSNKKGRGMRIFSGIFVLLTGIMVMHNPIGSELVFTFWMGLILLIAGVYNVINSFSLK